MSIQVKLIINGIVLIVLFIMHIAFLIGDILYPKGWA